MLLCMFEPGKDNAVRTMLGMDETPLEGTLPLRTVLTLVVVTLFSAVAYYVYSVNGGLAFREVGIQSSAELGTITFVPSMIVVLGSILFWMMGRYGSACKFFAFYLLLGLGLLLMGLAPGWKQMVAALCIQQVGAGMTVPVLLAWAQNQLPFEHRGRGMGVWNACFFLGQFISPPVVTLIRSQAGTMQNAFATIGVITLLAALVALVIAIRRRGSALSPNPATAR